MSQGGKMDLSNDKVIHIKNGNIEYLQFRKLLEYSDVISHCYSLGTNVNFRTFSKNDKINENNKDNKKNENEYEKVISDYKNLCDNIGLDYRNLVKGIQKHTNNVKCVYSKINKDEPDFNMEEYENIDGLVTNKTNIILSSTSADCISLLFFDPVKKVIANTHSGWKGTLQRISVKTIEKMVKEFNCKKEDIIVCICPSIRKCHFEVEEIVKDMFLNEFKELGEENLKEIIKEKVIGQKWNIDTVLINKIILKNIGVKEENIIDSKICTMCNPKILHSYRVEKENYGLNTAIIGLNNYKHKNK